MVVQEDRCFYCEGKISFDRSTGWLRATVDHFIPRSRGGSKGISNVVLACEGCNARKRDRPPSLNEFLKWNDLAALWPHIKSVSFKALFPEKACRLCGRPIPLDRLLKNPVSRSNTHTCSKRCSRYRRNRPNKGKPASRPGIVEQVGPEVPETVQTPDRLPKKMLPAPQSCPAVA